MLGKKDDAYCVASETCAFQAIGADYIRDIEPGELITITDDGIDFDKYTDYENPNLCSMEYIYFARADSEFRGNSTYRIRKALGERSEEHTSELQSRFDLVCRLLLEKKKK